MKTKLTMILAAMAAFTGVAMAEPEAETPVAPSVGRGNCDLMASNTVRAVFRGVQQVGEQSAAQVAVFEVVQNLAHKRVVRYGDGQMPAGMVFTVLMDRNLPGQPSSVVDEIMQMQPGEEAVMKIDHLFLFEEPQGQNLRPCTRLARKPATAPGAAPALPGTIPPAMPQTVPPTAPVQPAAPAPVLPAGNTGSGVLYGAAQ